LTWKSDDRYRKVWGDVSWTPQTNSRYGTAHLIELGPKKIRVLPDEAHSGQMRSRVSQEAAEQAGLLIGVSEAVMETYVIGCLAKHDLEWEWDVEAPSFDEWLEAWHWTWGEDPAKTLIKDMAAAGWTVSRVGSEVSR
jgi:hypothetical protein